MLRIRHGPIARAHAGSSSQGFSRFSLRTWFKNNPGSCCHGLAEQPDPTVRGTHVALLVGCPYPTHPGQQHEYVCEASEQVQEGRNHHRGCSGAWDGLGSTMQPTVTLPHGRMRSGKELGDVHSLGKNGTRAQAPGAGDTRAVHQKHSQKTRLLIVT